jgi:hypothetical protein
VNEAEVGVREFLLLQPTSKGRNIHSLEANVEDASRRDGMRNSTIGQLQNAGLDWAANPLLWSVKVVVGKAHHRRNEIVDIDLDHPAS